MSEGNLLALVVMVGWPLWALYAFKRWPAHVACAIVLVSGDLFMPPRTTLDLPGVPPLTKEAISPLSALLGCILFRRSALRPLRYASRTFFGLMLACFAGIVLTTISNSDTIPLSTRVIPGHSAMDAMAVTFHFGIRYIVPVALGVALYTTPARLNVLLAALTVGGLAYVPLCFIEMRFSPQINTWVYGFHQHQFVQSMRGDGFRPLVFMRHGLNNSFYFALAATSAAALARQDVRIRGVHTRVWFGILAFTLLLCRSSGAVILLFFALACLWLPKSTTRAKVIMGVVTLVLSYPLLRWLELIPLEWIVAKVTATIGPDRAESLAFRLRNEENLLHRGLLRPLLGWGVYGRGFIYEEGTDRVLSVVDGHWIIQVSTYGIWGFLSFFGFNGSLIFGGARRLGAYDRSPYAPSVSAAVLCGAMLFFDQLLNSSTSPYNLLLLGTAGGLARDARARSARRKRDEGA